MNAQCMRFACFACEQYVRMCYTAHIPFTGGMEHETQIRRILNIESVQIVRRMGKTILKSSAQTVDRVVIFVYDSDKNPSKFVAMKIR